MKNFVKFTLFIFTFAVFFNTVLCGENSNNEVCLQAIIHAVPLQSPGEEKALKVQPGTPMTLKVIVKNTGNIQSSPGEISLRFTFPHPLDNHFDALLFETEKKELPSIDAKGEITLSFSKPHQWPTIYEYISQDWGLRQYQAIVDMRDDKDLIIGTQSIAFSGYYYEGVPLERPLKISPSDSRHVSLK